MARSRSDTASHRLVLNDKQFRKLRRLARIFRKPDRALMDYHTCASLLLSIRPATGRYGSEWADSVEDALAEMGVELSRSLIYRLVKFGKLFTRKEVKKYSGRVTWETLLPIIHVHDPANRT